MNVLLSTKVSYSRVLIEVDVSKPLPKAILVEDEDGQAHDQAFFIGWVPHFFQTCQVIGHICDGRPPRTKML